MKKLLLILMTKQSTATGYPDVPSNHRFYEDIMYLLDQEVISQSNRFGIEDYVTREEVAVMISKSINFQVPVQKRFRLYTTIV